jgi:hypothetical protein
VTGPCFGPHTRKRVVSRRALLRRCRTRDGSQFAARAGGEPRRRCSLTHLNARPPGIHTWQLATHSSWRCNCTSRPMGAWKPGQVVLGGHSTLESCRLPAGHGNCPTIGPRRFHGVTGRVPMANQVAPRQPGPPTSMQKKKSGQKPGELRFHSRRLFP